MTPSPQVMQQPPFPTEEPTDPLIVFHGCSSTSESLIDTQGFEPGRSRFSKQALLELDQIFEDLRWSGISGMSRAVLRPFALGHDLKVEAKKPTFFAESASRAATFASIEFAGGEIARSVRYCFEELKMYLLNEEVRSLHNKRIESEIMSCRRVGALEPEPLPHFEAADLQARIDALASLEEDAANLKQDHSHGVVYEVQLTLDDLRRMKLDRSMGLQAFHHVPASKIRTKYLIPSNYDSGRFGTASDWEKDRWNVWKQLLDN